MKVTPSDVEEIEELSAAVARAQVFTLLDQLTTAQLIDLVNTLDPDVLRSLDTLRPLTARTAQPALPLTEEPTTSNVYQLTRIT